MILYNQIENGWGWVFVYGEFESGNIPILLVEGL